MFYEKYGRIHKLIAGIFFVMMCVALPKLNVVAADEQMISMYQRAVDLPEGDLSRLAQVMKKAGLGEEITIGFIGGSITEGRGASSAQSCYASLVYSWWQQAFPQTKINMVNAGVGGTSSYLGVHRVDTELLAYKPDLVFMEFAVNDTYTEFCACSYENLIRKILASDSSPALVLLFATNEYGSSSQDIEAALGEYYKLPMISYGNAVMPEIEAGSFAWTDIAEDVVHPNDMGHYIFARIITMYLEQIYSRADSIETDAERRLGYELPEACTPQIYQNAHIENASTIEPVYETGYGIYNFNYHFTDNWYALEDNAFIAFNVEAENIGILYQRTVEGSFGQYDVYVDGVYMATLDGDYVELYGTETDTAEIYKSPENQTAAHNITIVKNPESVNTDFVIIGLLLS